MPQLENVVDMFNEAHWPLIFQTQASWSSYSAPIANLTQLDARWTARFDMLSTFFFFSLSAIELYYTYNKKEL